MASLFDADRFGANNNCMIKLIEQNLMKNSGLTLSGACNCKVTQQLYH